MRIALAVLIGLHGVIHLLGPSKAFGWADVTQLRAPISAEAGLLWLLAAALLVISAGALALHAAWWWYPGLVGVVLSQGLIITAWGDARVGTLANIVILLAVLVAALDTRPSSFRSRFEHDCEVLLAGATVTAPIVTDADLAPLPPLMQTYLRRMGVVGRPRVRNLYLTFKAQMRSGPKAAWMQATAMQCESFDPPARLFFMKASRVGIPFAAFHRYVGGAATFQVRLAGLVPIVDKKGPGTTHDETVTMMNDVVVMAPAAVLDLPFTFESAGPSALRATFQNAGFTVSGVLTFNDDGDLVGFVSDDRSHDRDEGPATWSTPISGYREVDGIRVGTRGDANWIDSSGEWTYGRFEITSLAYNVREAPYDSGRD